MSSPFIAKYLKGTLLFLPSSLCTGSETEILSTEAEILCQLETGASNTVTYYVTSSIFIKACLCHSNFR